MRNLLLLCWALLLLGCPASQPNSTTSPTAAKSPDSPSVTASQSPGQSVSAQATPGAPGETPLAERPTPGSERPRARFSDVISPELSSSEFSELTGFDYTPYLTDVQVESAVEQHDFGKVDQGEHLSVEFQMENNREGSLRLGPVASSIPCCVTGEFGDEDLQSELEPGQIGTLRVTLDTGRQFRDLAANVVVPHQMDDGTTGAFVYRVFVYVEPLVEPEPSLLSLDSESGSFVLKSDKFGSGLKIVDVESAPPDLKVTPGKVEGNKQTFHVDASNLARGERNGAIKLLTNNEKVPDVVVGWRFSPKFKAK